MTATDAGERTTATAARSARDIEKMLVAVLGASAQHTAFELITQRRGWTMATLDELSRSTDEPLPDLDAGVELLHRAILADDEITVVTDYDMDGVAAGLLTYAGLAELGARSNLVVPHYTGLRDVTAAKVDQVMEAAQKSGHPLQCVSEPVE